MGVSVCSPVITVLYRRLAFVRFRFVIISVRFFGLFPPIIIVLSLTQRHAAVARSRVIVVARQRIFCVRLRIRTRTHTRTRICSRSRSRIRINAIRIRFRILVRIRIRIRSRSRIRIRINAIRIRFRIRICILCVCLCVCLSVLACLVSLLGKRQLFSFCQPEYFKKTIIEEKNNHTVYIPY